MSNTPKRKKPKAAEALDDRAQTTLAILTLRGELRQAAERVAALERETAERDLVIAALILKAGKKGTLRADRKHLNRARSGDYVGFSVETSDEGVTMTLLKREQDDEV